MWYREPGAIDDLVAQHGSLREVARRMGVDVSTLSRWRSRQREQRDTSASSATVRERPGATITGDAAVLVSRPNPRGTATLTPDDLLRAHGLEPDDWDVTPTMNAWDALVGDGSVTTLAQLKIVAKRRRPLDLILPARPDGWKPKRVRRRRPVDAGKPTTWLVVSDLHAPYHDVGLHRAICRFLDDVRPDRAVDLGDQMDLPSPSRHRATPGWKATPNECIQSAHEVWADRVAACETTAWSALLGNHDDRIRIAAEERIPQIADLRAAGEDLSVFDVSKLLHLDRLGVDLIRPAGEYHAAEVWIAPTLVGRHGTKTGAKGQPGAGKAADRLTVSILQGHDHRQGLVYLTRWEGQERAGDVVAASVGMSCERVGGLGYAEDPDWQPGAAFVTVWDDGRFNVELLRWDAGELVWRDRRYSGGE